MSGDALTRLQRSLQPGTAPLLPQPPVFNQVIMCTACWLEFSGKTPMHGKHAQVAPAEFVYGGKSVCFRHYQLALAENEPPPVRKRTGPRA